MVLTYHPLNNRIKRILLDNFKILSDDPATKEIFPQPPMVAYQRDQNLRNILVHMSASNQATALSGSAPCRHSPCRTCNYISKESTLHGPTCFINIKETFTCDSSGLVYCISCRHCLAIYISETGRTLRERFGEHLQSITKCAYGFYVAEHFNSHGHCLDDMQVRSVKLCGGNKLRKRYEMQLIFQLETWQPHRLNSDFWFC